MAAGFGIGLDGLETRYPFLSGATPWKQSMVVERISSTIMNDPGVFVVGAHWCEYDDLEREGGLNKKPTHIVGTGPWLLPIIKKCSGLHQHGTPSRLKSKTSRCLRRLPF